MVRILHTILRLWAVYGNNHRIVLCQLAKVNKIAQWSVKATSDHLPSSNKDARATDSCFSLTGAHQCGILIVIGGWLADSVSTRSETLLVTGRDYQSNACSTLCRQDGEFMHWSPVMHGNNHWIFLHQPMRQNLTWSTCVGRDGIHVLVNSDVIIFLGFN